MPSFAAASPFAAASLVAIRSDCTLFALVSGSGLAERRRQPVRGPRAVASSLVGLQAA